MYIHEEAKVGFLAHPRMASTATAEALREQAGFKPSHQHHATPMQIMHKHPEHYDVNLYLGEWRIFSIIRNHFRAFRTWHLSTNYGNEITPEVLELICTRERHFDTRYQPPFWKMFYHLPFCTDYVRWENLDEELNTLLVGCGLPEVELREVNTSRDAPPYQELFDEKCRDWIVEHFNIEMKRYNYRWNSG